MTAPLVAPERATPLDPEDLDHYHCCDDLVAICGYAAAPDDPWIPWTDEPEANDCPACVAAHQISPEACGVCRP